MDSSDWATYFVITACFIAGYSIVSSIIKKMKKSDSPPIGEEQTDPSGYKKNGSGSGPEGSASFKGSQEESERTWYRKTEQERKDYKNQNLESYGEEQRYAAILGLGFSYTSDEIKKAFRVLIAKYHPDKVKHLGDEFQKISELKTREIMEAYCYFRRKYNIK